MIQSSRGIIFAVVVVLRDFGGNLLRPVPGGRSFCSFAFSHQSGPAVQGRLSGCPEQN
jgi:hypothetical protein